MDVLCFDQCAGLLNHTVMHCLVRFTSHTEQKVTQDLVKILVTAAKKTITRSWYKSDSPQRNQWLDVIPGNKANGKTDFLVWFEGLFTKRWQNRIQTLDSWFLLRVKHLLGRFGFSYLSPSGSLLLIVVDLYSSRFRNLSYISWEYNVTLDWM